MSRAVMDPGVAADLRWEEIRSGLDSEQRQLMEFALRAGWLSLPLSSTPSDWRPHESRWFESWQTSGLSVFGPHHVAGVVLDSIEGKVESVEDCLVALAATTPDVFIARSENQARLDGFLARVARASTRRGERVLLLCNDSDRLDQILDAIGGEPHVHPLRVVDSGLERDGRSIRFTLEERRQTLRQRISECARLALCETRQNLARLAEEECRWKTFAPSVETPPDAKPGSYIDVNALHAELEGIERELAALALLRQAQERARWWSPSWWRAIFSRSRLLRRTDLERRREELCRLLTNQTNGTATTRETAENMEQLQSLLQPSSAEPMPSRLQESDERYRQWQERLRQEQHKARMLERLSQSLDEFVDVLCERLPHLTNLIAGSSDVVDSWRGRCDTVLILDADQWPQDFLASALRDSRRCVLCATTGGKGDSLLERLFDALRDDPSRPPHVWESDEAGLHCRFGAVDEENRGFVGVEPLYDDPSVQLHISTAPGKEATLAQLTFSDGRDLASAKRFCFEELDVAAIWADWPNLCVVESEAEYCVPLSRVPIVAEPIRVPLTEGVVEECSSQTRGVRTEYRTTRLRFAKTHFPTIERVADWLREYAGLKCTGRTAEI